MGNSITTYQSIPNGVSVKRNKNKFLAVRIHYSAVPAFNSDEWVEKAKQGYISKE